jgi:hypothetical protein
MSSNKRHLHLWRHVPLHPNQRSHDISLSYLHYDPHFPFLDLFHNLCNLINLIQLALQ